MTRLEGEAAARRRAGASAAVVLALLLAACSAVPDWADPTDWFEKDQAPTTISATGLEAAKSESFPNLASVPDSRPQTTPAAVRAELRQGLAADRANAEYSGQRLTGQPAMARQAGAAEPAGAPAAPGIAAELSGTPAQPAPAAAQASGEAGGVQSTQAAAAKPQLRFKQFQDGGASAAAPAAAPVLTGPAELVAVIYFGYGSAGLNADDREVLRQVTALQRQRGAGVRVIGHASARTGTVEPMRHRTANFEMSRRRADAVRAALISLGVAGDRVSAEAQGDSQPVYHEFTPTGEAGNRRAEIFLVY